MPYKVKGMDLSFSGLLSYCEDLVLMNEELKNSLLENYEKIDENKKKKKLFERKQLTKTTKI